MAVLIPEAAEAVTGGQAAVSGAGATARASAPAASKAAPKARSKAAAVPPGGGKGKKKKDLAPDLPKDKNKKIRLGGKGKSIGAGRYQPVILAEFLVAVLVVSIPPLAKGGDATAQAKQSPSPYSTDTLKQLIAVGAVYFILALLSGSQRLGKFAAWFGGLTLLGIGLLQTANGDLTALFKIFGPGQPPADAAAAGQVVSGAVSGALGSGQNAATQKTPDATGLFPTVEPGGQIVTSQANIVLPPAGGTGVTTTTGADQGANLA